MKSAGLLVAIFLAAPARGTDLGEIVARGKLRVLVSADEDPRVFNLQTEGEPGFERQLLEAFSRTKAVSIEAVRVARFETIVNDLARGAGDVIVGIIDTPERRKVIDFTAETLPARHLIVNLRSTAPIQNPAALLPLNVGTVKGTTWWQVAVATGYPESRLQPFPDNIALVEALRSGKIDATVMSLWEFLLLARRFPGLQAGAFVGEVQLAAWGVRKSDPQLRHALDDFLTAVRRTETWSRLIVRYFGEDALSLLARPTR